MTKPPVHSSDFVASRAPASIAPSQSLSLPLMKSASAFLFQPKVGNRYTYGFERKIRIQGLSGNSIPDIQYRGKLFVDVVAGTRSGFDALVTEEVDGQDRAEALPLRIQLDAPGKKLSVRAPRASSDAQNQHLGILKDLLANWIFTLDSDTVGAYQAAVHPIASNSDYPLLEKRKLAYTPSRSVRPEIVSSEHLIEWDPTEAIPHSLRGDEVTRLGGGTMKLTSEGHYRIWYLAKGPRPPQQSGLSAMKFHADTLGLNPDPSARGRSRWNAAQWPGILHRLSYVSSLSSTEQLQLFSDLAGFLKEHGEFLPDLLNQLGPTVISAGPSSPLFKVAVGALATAGTAAAQAALVQIYQDSGCSVAGKGTILAALTTTQASLSPQTRDFLLIEGQTQANTDLANGAEWALGSALQNAPNDASAQRAISAIQDAWTAVNQTEGQRLALLDAIGNSGRSEFLPILSGLIDGGASSALRSKAVFALRFIQTPDAISLLNQQLSDSNATVRLAAAVAMQVAPWNSSFAAPLQRCVLNEGVVQIQSACQSALKNSGG